MVAVQVIDPITPEVSIHLRAFVFLPIFFIFSPPLAPATLWGVVDERAAPVGHYFRLVGVGVPTEKAVMAVAVSVCFSVMAGV